ncbi:MAG: hypothetical protein NZ480_04125 [Bdellovibrionaceae bacterium]|nr:hypothetical protein [Pseudobdellovibrionaceae bacterium]MDW8189946.1 hypothetical protein [Pseudobdellovibrionaceae bacterium]
MTENGEEIKSPKWRATTCDLKRALADWNQIKEERESQSIQDQKKIAELKQRIAEVKLILKECGMDL